jgi:hypothetical protein
MTTSQAIINNIKDDINNEFGELSFKDYENLCYGDGTLAILDKVISNYDHIEFTDTEANELAEHCMQRSKAFGRKIHLHKISKDLADAISRAFVDDQRGIARFKFWLDIYTMYAQQEDDEHVDNYHQLLLELMAQRNLQESELNKYVEEYEVWLRQQMDSIMDGFAEACADGVYDIDDHDDWLAWLTQYDECTYQDMRYIDMHWDDDAKAKYRRESKVGYKLFSCNNDGTLDDETDYFYVKREAAIRDFKESLKAMNKPTDVVVIYEIRD